MDARVAVVTGASAGVGRAVVRELAGRGYRVGLLARGEDGLKAAAAEVEAAGGEALVLPCDVADAEAVQAAADAVVAEWGRLDVWVNNAMASVFAKVVDVRPEEFRRVTEVTYLGFVHGTLAALRHMRPAGSGVIVQVGSALAYRGIPAQAAYCGAKHAIQGFTDSLRCELLAERSGVRVCNVHLPAMNTPQFSWVLSRLPREPQPVPPIYQPEVAARAVAHVAEHPRREVWVGLPTAKTIVGQRVAPWLLDRILAKNGIDAQQTQRPVGPRQPNLWAPVAGDHGAHGSFGHRSRDGSVQAWAALHRGPLAAAAGLAGVAALAATRAARR